MFYSAHDDVLPFQLVGIGLIMPETKQPRSKLAAKLCWKLSCAGVSLKRFSSCLLFFVLITIFLF